MSIGTDGTVSATGADGTLTELSRIENNALRQSGGLAGDRDNLSSKPRPQAPAVGGRREGPRIAPWRVLEGSNVNVVEELVDMIETQRAYEVNSKMIQATGEAVKCRAASKLLLGAVCLRARAVSAAARTSCRQRLHATPVPPPPPPVARSFRTLCAADLRRQPGRRPHHHSAGGRTAAAKSNAAGTQRDGNIGLTPPSTRPLSLFNPAISRGRRANSRARVTPRNRTPCRARSA